MRRLRMLMLGLCLIAGWKREASAQTVAPKRPIAREDPSRPGRAQRKVGWYVRGGLGLGYGSAHVIHDVELRSETQRGFGHFEAKHAGFGARADAIGALRLKPALIGLAFIAGNTEGSGTSNSARQLGIEPLPGTAWWLIGPMGGVQLGKAPAWVIGGMLGGGQMRTGSFRAAEGTSVTSSRVHDSMFGASAWAGPSWPLGKGWMIGAHMRVTGMRSNFQFQRAPDTGSEAALLANVSFQSP